MKTYKFIDLFAGIGGFHLAFEHLGCECVFASEIDEQARKTYIHNFKRKTPNLFNKNLFNTDIRKISPEDIPDFDILCAGFPCQPFSQAGHKRGFSDSHKSERGNLFFSIVDILEAKKPKAFFLENVRGLISHDNGKTFKTIRHILENELGYNFHYKVVKASDYGLPQLRPRTFIIGFKDKSILSNFSFPPPIPLKFNMSDVWEGKCSREVGFTLRVGGRGSNINDRRNWDSYLVNNETKKIMPAQARKMQGFPDDFEFPVNNTQAMKQLGNSIAVDAVQTCAKAMLEHMQSLILDKGDEIMPRTKNKGEWTELYTFIKIINDRKLLLSDKNLNAKSDKSHFIVKKVSTLNISQSCLLSQDDEVNVIDLNTNTSQLLKVSHFLNSDILSSIAELIKNGTGTFEIPQFQAIQNHLGISIISGGNSKQKSDIVLDIENEELSYSDVGFGIKSFLGSKPTLLNASGNTNFIYEVIGVDKSELHKINAIETRTKLKDRIDKIYSLGGKLIFKKIEKDTMKYNLSMVDNLIPQLLSQMILEFFVNRTSSISDNISKIAESQYFKNEDLTSLQVKIKRLLISIMLGLFPGTKWNGKLESKGIIVVKNNGEQLAFHIIDMESLEDYLYETIKFDTPSTTRHRFGNLILENDGKLYFKLNLQLRF